MPRSTIYHRSRQQVSPRLPAKRGPGTRALLLMREHQRLSPQRQPQPLPPQRGEGSSLGVRPNQTRCIDATAGFSCRDGPLAIFALIDPYPACCLGIHAAKRGTRLEALKPVRQAVKEQSGGARRASPVA